MGMVPTLLNIYARNQRFHHNRKSQEQERKRRDDERAAASTEAEKLAVEAERARELERKRSQPSPFGQSSAAPLSKFRMS
jgi:hypothetical protein